MAFIEIKRAANDPDNSLLVNTDHIASVKLSPYAGSGDYTHQINVNIMGNASFTSTFASLEAAQNAYDNLTNTLTPEAPVIAFY